LSLDFTQEKDGRISYHGAAKMVDELISDSSKQYSFSDPLKEFCVNTLGVDRKQCYGTDEEKNSQTKLMWDNLPLSVRFHNSENAKFVKYEDGIGELEADTESLYYAFNEQTPFRSIGDIDSYDNLPRHTSFEKALQQAAYHEFRPSRLRTGPMTGREVMQVFGTDIMRQMFDQDVWVRATINKIKNEAPPVALIADCRFRSEFAALNNQGAVVIRLERNVYDDDHPSETDFDGFPFTEYDNTLVIPDGLTLDEQNQIALNFLEQYLKDTTHV
jgi:hypothetical protein